MIDLSKFIDNQLRCSVHPDREAFFYDRENERCLCADCYRLYQKEHGEE